MQNCILVAMNSMFGLILSILLTYTLRIYTISTSSTGTARTFGTFDSKRKLRTVSKLSMRMSDRLRRYGKRQ